MAFDFLTSGPTYTLDGDTLTLTSGDLVITLVDREIAVPDPAADEHHLGTDVDHHR